MKDKPFNILNRAGVVLTTTGAIPAIIGAFSFIDWLTIIGFSAQAVGLIVLTSHFSVLR
jgi:hypothetical protein